MVNEQFITKMTIYNYTIWIYLQLYSNGKHGFLYRMQEDGTSIDNSLPLYDTALIAAHAALDKLQEVHNEKK